MSNKINYKAFIAALAIIPSIQAAITFPTFPTIQDQIFNFPKYDLHPPRIPLKYIRGVVMRKAILYIQTVYLTMTHVAYIAILYW